MGYFFHDDRNKISTILNINLYLLYGFWFVYIHFIGQKLGFQLKSRGLENNLISDRSQSEDTVEVEGGSTKKKVSIRVFIHK